MTSDNLVSKWTKGVLLAIVLIAIATSVVVEYDAAAFTLSPNSTCTDAGGVYNTSQTITCHEAANNSAAVGNKPLPLGGLFDNNGVTTLIIMAVTLILLITGLFYLGRNKR